MALGGGEARRIWQWSTRDSTWGMVKTWETVRQSMAVSQSQGLYVLVKEAVVPKEFKLSKEDRT